MKLRHYLLGILTASLLTSCVEDIDGDDPRDPFLGFWTCNEYEGDFAPQTYLVEVTPVGSGSEVRIWGLYGLGSSTSLTGSVSGSTIFIDTQTLNGITFSGFGTINSAQTEVEVSFTASDAGIPDNVKARWVR